MSKEQAHDTKGLTVKLLSAVDLGPEIEGMQRDDQRRWWRDAARSMCRHLVPDAFQDRQGHGVSQLTGSPSAGAVCQAEQPVAIRPR